MKSLGRRSGGEGGSSERELMEGTPSMESKKKPRRNATKKVEKGALLTGGSSRLAGSKFVAGPEGGTGDLGSGEPDGMRKRNC